MGDHGSKQQEVPYHSEEADILMSGPAAYVLLTQYLDHKWLLTDEDLWNADRPQPVVPAGPPGERRANRLWRHHLNNELLKTTLQNVKRKIGHSKSYPFLVSHSELLNRFVARIGVVGW